MNLCFQKKKKILILKGATIKTGTISELIKNDKFNRILVGGSTMAFFGYL